MRAFAGKHPVVAYFTATFALSWGGLLWLSGGPAGVPASPEEVEQRLPLFVACVLVGPSVSGIFLTGLVDGRRGLQEMRSRLAKWRVAAVWYALALLMAPLVMSGVLAALSLVSPRYVPAVLVADDKAALVLAGTATALGAGIFEELGWTGFAIPKLRLRYGIFKTGLIVGVLWAAWHILPALWLSGTVSGRLSLASYMLDPFLFLVGFRVLMVWAYDRTGSLLLAMGMHASLTFSARVLTPQGISGVPLLTLDGVWAAAMSIVIAAVAAAETGTSGRARLRPPST